MPRKAHSLQKEILLRLFIPLLLFMSVETVLSYFVTLHYVNSAYDRWLLDSAKSLAQEIKVQQGQFIVELPPAALEMFRWDDTDKTYFKIISTQQGLMAGDKQVPEMQIQEESWTQEYYFDAKMRDEPVRVVLMVIKTHSNAESIYVYVAETLKKRRTMMWDILLADLLPQTLLVIFVSIYLRLGIKTGLKPLHTLANEIAQRSSRDLRPIPEAQVFTEVRVLISTINDLLGRLASAIATQQRFISNAAHQLRTPLAGLKLQAERALRAEDITAMQPALEHIQNSADRMSHLTSQLLILARTEPISGSYELINVNLTEIVRQACMQSVPKAWQRKIELSFDGPSEAVIVQGDAILLGELLSNLIDNAIIYGREHGSILVALTPHPTPALSVIDDGIGIPEHESEKIFERFYRIAGSHGQGCGLGLAIVKEIADLHKAQISLTRISPEGGTRVDLCFPGAEFCG